MERGLEPPAPAHERWASRTLDRALWQSAVLGLAGWQLALGVFVTLRDPRFAVALLTFHVALALLALPAAAVTRNIPVRAAWFSGLLALLTADLALSTDGLATTVVCMTFVVAVTPILVMRPWLAILVAGAGVTSAVALSITTRSSGQLAAAIGAPAACYAVAALSLITVLREFTTAVDDTDAALAGERDRLASSRAAASTAAAYARALHDTAINTLAAIASGGSAVADDARVRRRCAADVEAIRSLDAGPDAPVRRLATVGAATGLEITWTVIAEAEHEPQLRRLDDSRRAALLGIVHELLLNVEKHAGTDRVTIDVSETPAALEVTVTDRGRGFVLDPAPGRGLAESVLGRATEAGIGVHLTTAPGAGTRAQLTCPRSVESADPFADDETTPGPGRILRFATWGWCVAVLSASLVSGAIGTGTPATFASVALIAAACFAAWVACRHGRSLPTWLALLVAATTPAAFVLGFIGANFDGGDPAFWQGIGLTPLLVTLLNTSRSKVPLAAASAALAAAAAGSAAVTWGTGPAVVAVANGYIQLAQLSIWLIFTRVLETISAHEAEARRHARRVHSERAAVDAAVTTQEHWREAQLSTALSLLDDIAAGRRAATDPHVRRLAGREEHLLRQTLMLTPALVHLGPWLARIIGQSRL